MTQRRVDVLLACSAGGHLLQLLALRPAWEGFSRLWVTDDTSDARSLLASEDVVYAHWPRAGISARSPAIFGWRDAWCGRPDPPSS